MDGERFRALEGETIAAALIAGGRRDFKRDRHGSPRGLTCGMGACFECEVSVDGGTPVRACMTKVLPGMQVCSVGYRKTPPVVDPAAAGAAGVANAGDDSACDVLVVGAGPAGITAALTLDAAGVSVILIDERSEPGGQYYKPLGASQRFVAGRAADRQYKEGRELAAHLASSGVEVRQGATVWGLFRGEAGQASTGKEQGSEPGFEAGIVAGGVPATVRATRVILAAGAFESIPPFPGWTLPGVMTTGAAQGLARSYRVAPGDRVLVAGNGPLNLQLACELLAGGIEVAAVAEAAPAALSRRLRDGLGLLASAPGIALRGVAYLAELKRRRVPVLHGYHVSRATGADHVEAVTLARLADDGRPVPGTERCYDIDALCLGYALQPANELARVLGCTHEAIAPGVTVPVRDAQGATDVPGVYVVGDGGVLGGAQVARTEGCIVADAISRSLGKGGSRRNLRANHRRLHRQRRFQRHLWSYYAAPSYVPHEPDALLCRCESVPLQVVTDLIDGGVTDFGSIKRLSRVGMGGCQGRYCQRQLATLVADRSGAAPAAEQLFEARFPARPVSIGEIAREKPDWKGYRSIEGQFATRSGSPRDTAPQLEADVLVVGAGVIGVCTALALAEAGVDVLVIDSGTPFAQASGTNAGSLHAQMLSSDFSDATARSSPASHAIALQRLGIAEWLTLESKLAVDFEMHLGGGLVVASTERELDFLKRKAELERFHGLDVDVVGKPGLAGLLPVVSPAMLGGTFCPSEGKINPLAAGPAIMEAARRAGVRLLAPCAIEGLAREKGVFHAAGSTARIRAGQVVNAAGGWAAGIAQLLGARLPVRTAPQQMLVTEPLEPLIPVLVAAAERHLSLKQVANGNVIIGGGWPAGFDPSRGRAVNLRESIEGNLWVAQHVIPALAGVRVLRSWATVGVMIDGAPILGEYPGIPGLFNSVGANGYTMGPIIGRITAGLVRGESPPLDLTPFLVERFG